VALYEMKLEEKKFNKLLTLSGQTSAITHICCNSELNLWVSASIDGYINLYTLPLCKLVRCIKIDSKRCSFAFLVSSPLPCIVAISDEEEGNNNIFVYSINGKLISKTEEKIQINNPIIIKDAYFNEYLAYLSGEFVFIVNLPNLKLVVQFEGIKDSHFLCSNEDMTLLYVLNNNGAEITLIRDEGKNNNAPSFVKNLVNKH